MAKTLEEKMQAALQKKAKAEKQLALLKSKERKSEDKAKILLGVMITKTLKENNEYFNAIRTMAEAYLTEADQKIVFDYLFKYIPLQKGKEAYGDDRKVNTDAVPDSKEIA